MARKPVIASLSNAGTILFASVLAPQAVAGSATYSYDALGRLSNVVYTSGPSVGYEYDPTGNFLNVVVAGPPSAPPTVTGSAIGVANVTFTFTPPSIYTGSPITGYVANCSPGGLTASVGASATSITVTGLARGTSYNCAVYANSAVGLGPPSTTQVVVGGSQTISFNSVVLLVGRDRAVPVTASSALPVTLTSSTPAVCVVVSGTTVRGVAVGNCTLQATQAGDANFLAAAPVTKTLLVRPIASVIGILLGDEE